MTVRSSRHQVSTAAPWLQGSTGHLGSLPTGQPLLSQYSISQYCHYRMLRRKYSHAQHRSSCSPKLHPAPAVELPCSAPELLQPHAAHDLVRTHMQGRTGSVRANSSTGPVAGTYPSAGIYPAAVSLPAVCSGQASGPYPFDASLMASCCRVFWGIVRFARPCREMLQLPYGSDRLCT